MEYNIKTTLDVRSPKKRPGIYYVVKGTSDSMPEINLTYRGWYFKEENYDASQTIEQLTYLFKQNSGAFLPPFELYDEQGNLNTDDFDVDYNDRTITLELSEDFINGLDFADVDTLLECELIVKFADNSSLIETLPGIAVIDSLYAQYQRENGGN